MSIFFLQCHTLYSDEKIFFLHQLKEKQKTYYVDQEYFFLSIHFVFKFLKYYNDFFFFQQSLLFLNDTVKPRLEVLYFYGHNLDSRQASTVH